MGVGVRWAVLVAGSLLLVLLAGPAPVAADQPGTVVLAEPADPYYALAEEIAQHERLPLAHSLHEALATRPTFLLWVVSPSHLSDQAIVAFGRSLRERPVAAGIVSGSTLDDARALWQRAAEVQPGQLVAANAANPSGHITSRISVWQGDQPTSQPLTKDGLLRSLQDARYLTFTGHGGRRYWRLDAEVMLHTADIPDLPPVVVSAASCNTFGIWDEESIALAFTDRGAAAYAGFAYSPIEGYLVGEFDGLPFRYTWPAFPIGAVVQVQNHGTVQGFADFPYYHLLGDPRIALQAEMPYHLLEDRMEGHIRTLRYSGAPAGIVPVRIAGGAEYDFVEIPGLSAAGYDDLPYNRRVQMVDIGDDKYLLVEHPGGDLTIRLQRAPSLAWRLGDLATDSLDYTLLYAAQTGGDRVSLIAAGLAVIAVALLLKRRRHTTRFVVPSALAGVACAALYALYAFLRLDHVTVTSKGVEFGWLAVISAGLLIGEGAFLFLSTRSWWARALALAVATFPTWATALCSVGVVAITNLLVAEAGTGASLYNHHIGLLALIAFLAQGAAVSILFLLLRRLAGAPTH